MDAVLLRDTLKVVLGDLIGTYRFTNGETTPAIAIDYNSTYPPPGTVIEGLEVVVIPRSSLGVSGLIGGKLATYQADVILKQWDITSDTFCATDRIIGSIPGLISISPRVIPDGELQNIESIRLTFQTQEARPY
jgi:hypothetical protein